MLVNLGGGRARYEQALDDASGNVIDYAKTKGQRVVTDAAGPDAVNSFRRNPVLGLFNSGNMTTQFAPLIGALSPGAGSPTTRCKEDNRPGQRAEPRRDDRQGHRPARGGP